MDQIQPSTLEDTIQICFSLTGNLNRLEANQWLPCSQSQLFDFFSDAFQLQELTPPWLHFEVLTPKPICITSGTLIDYKLRIKGLPVRWQSQINIWEPPCKFVDEQLRGPYRYWRHEHILEPVAGGTLCRDLIDFKAPCDRLTRLLVRSDLTKIFQFRQRRLHELFPSLHSESK
jgi:ligand-binding SRPBCC domain-containing protein